MRELMTSLHTFHAASAHRKSASSSMDPSAQQDRRPPNLSSHVLSSTKSKLDVPPVAVLAVNDGGGRSTGGPDSCRLLARVLLDQLIVVLVNEHPALNLRARRQLELNPFLADDTDAVVVRGSGNLMLVGTVGSLRGMARMACLSVDLLGFAPRRSVLSTLPISRTHQTS